MRMEKILKMNKTRLRVPMVILTLPIMVILSSGISYGKPPLAKRPTLEKEKVGELLRIAQKAEKKDDDSLLLGGPEKKPEQAKEEGKKAEETEGSASEAHEDLFAESRYPSASTCGTCHPKHFKEWSVSQHAYSQLSPVYMAINNFLTWRSITSSTHRRAGAWMTSACAVIAR